MNAAHNLRCAVIEHTFSVTLRVKNGIMRKFRVKAESAGRAEQYAAQIFPDYEIVSTAVEDFNA